MVLYETVRLCDLSGTRTHEGSNDIAAGKKRDLPRTKNHKRKKNKCALLHPVPIHEVLLLSFDLYDIIYHLPARASRKKRTVIKCVKRMRQGLATKKVLTYWTLIIISTKQYLLLIHASTSF